MKKILIGCFITTILFFSTGCDNNTTNNSKKDNTSGTLVCNKSETNEEGYKVEDEMIVTYKNNKVTKVEQTNIEEMDADMIETTYSFGTLFAKAFNEIDGMNVAYSKESNGVKFTMSVDYTKFDPSSLKETLGDFYDDDVYYSANDITIDEFKINNLEGYTCK